MIDQDHIKEAHDRVRKAHIDILRDNRFIVWSGLLMLGDVIVTDDVPTAMTDGRNTYYGASFISSLTIEMVRFVVLHENLHKAFRHLTLWRNLWKEDPQLANMACDYVINLIIVDMDPTQEFVTFPKVNGKVLGLYDERFRDMNALQVYRILKQEQEQEQGAQANQPSQPSQPSPSGKPDKPKRNLGGDESFDNHDWEHAKELDDADEDGKFAEEIDRTIRQGKFAHEKRAGKGSLSNILALNDLLYPEVPWQDVLREFMRSSSNARTDTTWARYNRRLVGQRLYMPHHVSEALGPIVVGVDTSGSVDGAFLTRFMSEVHDLCTTLRPEKLDLLYWDTSVAAHEEYGQHDLDNLLTSTKPKGGGGTDPRCVAKYLDAKDIRPCCVVMLTDGYVGSWGDDWDVPVLWVVVDNRKAKPTCGQVVYADL